MRLWMQLDTRIKYRNHEFLTRDSINQNRGTKEVKLPISIPKKMTSWFLNECQPEAIVDYLQYFEFLGTASIAMSQPWRHDSAVKFYEDYTYRMQGHCVVHGMHSWDRSMPWAHIIDAAPTIKPISLRTTTERGRLYQLRRGMACYPLNIDQWTQYCGTFNDKPFIDEFDLCTALVDADSKSILAWLKMQIGDYYDATQVVYASKMLDEYHRQVVFEVT